MLHKPDVDTLCDPEYGFAWRHMTKASTPFAPESSCGRIAGDITYRSREAAKSDPDTCTASSDFQVTAGSNGARGQRELPIFAIVGGTNGQTGKIFRKLADREIATLSCTKSLVVTPKSESEVDFNGDLSWIGKTKHPLKNKLVVWVSGMLYFGGLHYAEAARRTGRKSAKAFGDFKTHAGIPVDSDRSKFGPIFDEQCAYDTVAAIEYELRKCITTGNWFWVKRNDKRQRQSPTVRKREHQVEGRYDEVKLLKGKDAKPKTKHFVAPFAKFPEIIHANRNTWSVANA